VAAEESLRSVLAYGRNGTWATGFCDGTWATGYGADRWKWMRSRWRLDGRLGATTGNGSLWLPLSELAARAAL